MKLCAVDNYNLSYLANCLEGSVFILFVVSVFFDSILYHSLTQILYEN